MATPCLDPVALKRTKAESNVLSDIEAVKNVLEKQKCFPQHIAETECAGTCLKPYTWEGGAGRSQVRGQPDLNSQTLSSKANKQNVAHLTHIAMRRLKNRFS